MPGIIITPGTFNPPASPAETNGVLTFPRKKVVTLRAPWMQQQWSTRRAAPAVAPGFDCVYTYRDFMAAGMEFGQFIAGLDVESLDMTKTSFGVKDVRWSVDKSYDVVGASADAKTYVANATIEFLPQPVVGTPENPSTAYPEIKPLDIGTHILEQGGSPLSYDRIPIYLTYDIDVVGTADDDEHEYTVAVNDYHSGGEEPEGELLLIAHIEPGPPPTYERLMVIDETIDFSFILFRDGVPFDKVYFLVQVTGSVHIMPLDGGAVPTPQPSITSDEHCEETLYGATATNPIATQPTIKATIGYARESWAKEGKVYPS